MSNEIANKRDKLLKERAEYSAEYCRYLNINSELDKLQSECKHENLYWYDEETDTYEGRTYEKRECPDCGYRDEERIYCGKHTVQSKKEYLEKIDKESMLVRGDIVNKINAMDGHGNKILYMVKKDEDKKDNGNITCMKLSDRKECIIHKSNIEVWIKNSTLADMGES